MKNIFFLILALGIGYKIWGYYEASNVKPLYNEPYLVIYGRDNCGFTQHTIKELKKAHIPFEYHNVDDKSVADILHSRMASMGLDTRHYLLPVVDLNNSFTIRPNSQELISRAKSLPLSSH